MDLKRIQQPGLGSLDNVTGGTKSTDRSQGVGASFKDTLEKLGSVQNQQSLNPALSGLKVPGADSVKFSNHAIERMQSRGIRYSPEQMLKINDAVGKAAAKGSKDSLILMDDSALIVSVKNKTVVTVMDKTALKENVFTNIDSTIVM